MEKEEGLEALTHPMQKGGLGVYKVHLCDEVVDGVAFASPRPVGGRMVLYLLWGTVSEECIIGV